MVPAIYGLARTIDPAASPLKDAVPSPAAVETAWVAFNVSERLFVDGTAQTPQGERARQAALRQYFEHNNVAAARALWHQQTDPPRNLTELAMAADLEAEAASEAALPLIERLRQWQPAEADIILATLRARQGRIGESTAALAAALERLRTDPWPLPWYKEKAMQLAEVLASSGPPQASRLYEALRQPFALRAQEDRRLELATAISRHVDFPRLCREPIDPLDEHPAWDPDFLRLRMECFRATNDPRLGRATRDLEDYLSVEVAPLGAGLSAPR
jgi:hypothetical protein